MAAHPARRGRPRLLPGSRRPILDLSPGLHGHKPIPGSPRSSRPWSRRSDRARPEAACLPCRAERGSWGRCARTGLSNFRSRHCAGSRPACGSSPIRSAALAIEQHRNGQHLVDGASVAGQRHDAGLDHRCLGSRVHSGGPRRQVAQPVSAMKRNRSRDCGLAISAGWISSSHSPVTSRPSERTISVPHRR